MTDYSAVMDEKVFIAIPQHELGRYVGFEIGLDRLQLTNYTIKQRLCGIYLPNSQNAMARMFMDTECEWFWLLNDDQYYPPETLLQLLSHKKDIVIPLSLEKVIPHWPLIYDDCDENGFFRRRMLKARETGLVRIWASGGGGMLVHRRVFEAIPDPWWTVTMRMGSRGWYEQTTEDFDFAKRVKDAGIEMWCDLDIHVVHMALYGIRPAMQEGTGEWVTALIREGEQILIPKAMPPPKEKTPDVAKEKKWVTL